MSLVFVSCGKSNNVKPSGAGQPLASTVTVSTFAGNGIAGYQDGSGDVVEFDASNGLAVDSKGNVFVTDPVFNKVRSSGNSAIAGDSKGNVFVGAADRVYKITPLGLVSIYAENGVTGSADAPVAKASFNHVKGIAIDQNNNLYISDSGNNKIKIITPDGITSTLAGTGASGFADGPGDKALF